VKDRRLIFVDPDTGGAKSVVQAVPGVANDGTSVNPGRSNRTSTPLRVAPASASIARSWGAKYAFVIQILSRAAATIAARTEAVSPCPRPGRESSTSTRAPPSSGGASGWSSRSLPPAALQASEKTVVISQAAGPSTRACVSRQARPDSPPVPTQYSSAIFIPPVKAIFRSTTRIFR
jgi:hypothetical protein